MLSDYSHLRLLELIFVERNYDVEPLAPPRVVVDLGSNIGLSVLFFACKYPGARVLGVEPDPGAFELLQRNAGRLGGVTVRHAAVGDREGVATFWSAPGRRRLLAASDPRRPGAGRGAGPDAVAAAGGRRRSTASTC